MTADDTPTYESLQLDGAGDPSRPDGHAAHDAGGAAQAFEANLTRHGPWLFSLAWHLTGEGARAVGLSQETLVRHARSGGGIDTPGDDLIRRLLATWRERARAVPTGGAGVRVPHGTHGERLRRSLAALTPDERAAVVLRVAGGLSYERIAAALGMPADGVPTLLGRARSRLHRLMQS